MRVNTMDELKPQSSRSSFPTSSRGLGSLTQVFGSGISDCDVGKEEGQHGVRATGVLHGPSCSLPCFGMRRGSAVMAGRFTVPEGRGVGEVVRRGTARATSVDRALVDTAAGKGVSRWGRSNGLHSFRHIADRWSGCIPSLIRCPYSVCVNNDEWLLSSFPCEVRHCTALRLDRCR